MKRSGRPANKNGEKFRDYSTKIDEYWPTIELAWNTHADKHPVIECDLGKRQVIADPAEAYIEGLTGRTREETRRLYERTVRDGSMMLFIRDPRNRILQSYIFRRTQTRERQEGSGAGS